MGGGPPNEYVSFILRMWHAKNGEEQTWRASLEDPRTGERVGFGSLDALFDHLRGQTEPVGELKAEAGKDNQD
jgi:hypothetical protein